MRYCLIDNLEYPDGYYFVILRDYLADKTQCFMGHHQSVFMIMVYEIKEKSLYEIKVDIANNFKKMQEVYNHEWKEEK